MATAHNIGFLFDSHYSFVPQISSLFKLFYHIRDLRRIRPFIDFKTTSTIATSIVHSKLDYYKSIYCNLHQTQMPLPAPPFELLSLMTPWNSKWDLSACCFIGAILKRSYSFISYYHSFLYCHSRRKRFVETGFRFDMKLKPVFCT
jgi:hypothetical protein